MSTHTLLGVKSKYVLMKLGYDLRDTLKDSIEAPVPDALRAKAETIPDRGTDRDVIVLYPSEYRVLGTDHLA